MAQLLIFDWDGTLCDSLSRIVAAIRSSAEAFELPVPSEQASRDIIGLGLREALAALFPGLSDRKIDGLRQRYAEYYISQDQEPSPLYPRVRETLLELKEAGFRMAVATGKSRKGLDRVLAGLDMSDFFDASRCADETCSKPDPLMLMELTRYFGVEAHDSLMVGDTTYDMEMARNARMPRVGVTYGAHDPQRLHRYQPIALLDCLSGLSESMQKQILVNES